MKKLFKSITLLLAAIFVLCSFAGCSFVVNPTLQPIATPEVAVDSDGVASWQAVDNALYYAYSINFGEDKLTNDCYVQLENDDVIMVKAVSGSEQYTDSEYSRPQKYVKGTVVAPNALTVPQVGINSDGLASWTAVAGAQHYVYVINDGAEKQTTALGVQLSDNDTIKVKAAGDGEQYTDSEFSQPVTYVKGTVVKVKLATPQVAINTEGTATWGEVANAHHYVYVINGGAETNIFSRSVQLSDNDTIKVKASSGGDEQYADSDYSAVKTYTVDKPAPPPIGPVLSDAAKKYYSNLTATSGNSLLGQLHDLITTTHTKYTTYADCKNPTYIVQTDPGSTSNTVRDFYTQENMSKNWGSGAIGTWNREHVWCQSLSNGLWGESGGGSDMHHIRPTETGLNSIRGNNKFGVATDGKIAYYRDTNGTNKYIGGYYVGKTTFEPLDKVKGDVARIVLYVYTHYNNYGNVYGTTNGTGGGYFGTLNFTHIMSVSSESAAIKMLIQWCQADPVDNIEMTRNEAVYKIQGNRNPFIDHPEYVNAIWG